MLKINFISWILLFIKSTQSKLINKNSIRNARNLFTLQNYESHLDFWTKKKCFIQNTDLDTTIDKIDIENETVIDIDSQTVINFKDKIIDQNIYNTITKPIFHLTFNCYKSDHTFLYFESKNIDEIKEENKLYDEHFSPKFYGSYNLEINDINYYYLIFQNYDHNINYYYNKNLNLDKYIQIYNKLLLNYNKLKIHIINKNIFEKNIFIKEIDNDFKIVFLGISLNKFEISKSINLYDVNNIRYINIILCYFFIKSKNLEINLIEYSQYVNNIELKVKKTILNQLKNGAKTDNINIILDYLKEEK